MWKTINDILNSIDTGIDFISSLPENIEKTFDNFQSTLEKLIDFAMAINIPYLAINFDIDTCNDCGFSGQIPNDHCPDCGGANIERLTRVTGYLTTDYRHFNEGKIDEVEQRVKHTIFNPECIPVLRQAYKELKEMNIGEFNEIQ